MDKGHHPQVVRPWKVERTKLLDRQQGRKQQRAETPGRRPKRSRKG